MGLWEAMTNLPAEIAGAAFNAISQQLVLFIQPLLEMAKALIIANINPLDFADVWLVIVMVISAFYLLLFMVVGLKFIIGSYDAEQRNQAKAWFKKAVLIVVLVNASLLIYGLLLQLSSGLALVLWSSEFESLFSLTEMGSLDFLWLAVFAFSLFFALLTLVVRQMALIVGVMVFPVGLFLYFIPPVEGYGSVILQLTGVAAFMNVMDVIIIIAVQMFYGQFAYLSMMSLLAPALGFFFIGLANLAVIYIAVQKALNSVGVKVSLLSVGRAVAGAVV